MNSAWEREERCDYSIRAKRKKGGRYCTADFQDAILPLENDYNRRKVYHQKLTMQIDNNKPTKKVYR